MASAVAPEGAAEAAVPDGDLPWCGPKRCHAAARHYDAASAAGVFADGSPAGSLSLLAHLLHLAPGFVPPRPAVQTCWRLFLLPGLCL